jgi:hypothetical protein
LDLSKTGPATAYEGDLVNYSFVLDGSLAAYGAQQVTLYDTLPPELAFRGPGPIQPENYPSNAYWRLTDDPMVIARGPFDVPPGGSLAVALDVEVRYGTQGNTVVNQASLTALNMSYTAQAQASLSVLTGLAPSRTPSPTFSPSPSFTESPTDTPTISPTPYNGSPTSSPTHSPTATMTDVVPVLVLSNVLQTDLEQVYVGKTISFTVTLDNVAGIGATNIELQVMRDLTSLNAVVAEAGAFPAGPQTGSGTNAWFWVDDDNKPTSPWRRGPYFGIPVGSSRTADLYYALLPSAAGRTLTCEVKVYSNGAFTGVSAYAAVPVKLYTPVSQVTDTPTPTPTPIVGVGQIAAYPQPARDTLSFDYWAPPGAGDELLLEVYNVRFQKVAVVRDRALRGVLQSTRINVSGLAAGVYVVRARLGDYSFPLSKFGIAR